MISEPRVVCVTGGGSGIGAALVAAFLDAGDRVHACGRDPDKLTALEQRHADAAASRRLICWSGDLTDAAFRDRLVAEIEADASRLDVLINNAGAIFGEGALEEDLEQWRATLEINLIAPFALTQCCARLLERSAAPAIINLSSACAQHPFASCTSTSYSVSKAGLDMLTRRLALALGAQGVRVNAIAPGVVASPMWNGHEDLMRRTAARRHVLQQRLVTPEEVAAAALFLASDQAHAITGAILNIDAGYTLG